MVVALKHLYCGIKDARVKTPDDEQKPCDGCLNAASTSGLLFSVTPAQITAARHHNRANIPEFVFPR